MKTRIYFVKGIAVLFLALNVGFAQEVKILKDNSHYTCGFVFLQEYGDEIVQNTRLLNKNLPDTPLKMLLDRFYGLKYGYQFFGTQQGFGFESSNEDEIRKIKKKYQLN